MARGIKEEICSFFNSINNISLNLRVKSRLLKEKIGIIKNQINSKKEWDFYKRNLEERLDNFRIQEEKILYGDISFKRKAKRIAKNMFFVSLFGLIFYSQDAISADNKEYYSFLKRKPVSEEIVRECSNENFDILVKNIPKSFSWYDERKFYDKDISFAKEEEKKMIKKEREFLAMIRKNISNPKAPILFCYPKDEVFEKVLISSYKINNFNYFFLEQNFTYNKFSENVEGILEKFLLKKSEFYNSEIVSLINERNSLLKEIYKLDKPLTKRDKKNLENYLARSSIDLRNNENFRESFIIQASQDTLNDLNFKFGRLKELKSKLNEAEANIDVIFNLTLLKIARNNGAIHPTALYIFLKNSVEDLGEGYESLKEFSKNPSSFDKDLNEFKKNFSQIDSHGKFLRINFDFNKAPLESIVCEIYPTIFYKKKESFNESGKIPILVYDFSSINFLSSDLKILEYNNFDTLSLGEYLNSMEKIKQIKKDFLSRDSLDLLKHKRNWRNRRKEDYFGLVDVDLKISKYKKPVIILKESKEGIFVPDKFQLSYNPSDPDFDKEKIPAIKRNEKNLEKILSLTVDDDIYISDGYSGVPEEKIFEEFEKLKKRAILVNVPEFKLYLCENQDGKNYIIKEYGAGIGKEETPTWMPGREKQEFFISSKIYNPIWHPSSSFINDTSEVYKTDSENPMGTKKLELAIPEYVTGYAIHGTRDFNQVTWYIGKLVSRGCVRVPDIGDLYKRVIVGNEVSFLYKPLTILVNPRELRYEVLRDVYKKTPDLSNDLVDKAEIPWDYILNNSLVIQLED